MYTHIFITIHFAGHEAFPRPGARDERTTAPHVRQRAAAADQHSGTDGKCVSCYVLLRFNMKAFHLNTYWLCKAILLPPLIIIIIV